MGHATGVVATRGQGGMLHGEIGSLRSPREEGEGGGGRHGEEEGNDDDDDDEREERERWQQQESWR